jgi:hypothetical protein
MSEGNRSAVVSARALALVWLGMVGFGALNFVIFLYAISLSQAETNSLVPALVAALIVGGAAAFCAFVLRWRLFAAGLLIGYALMTIVSGGTCTLFVDILGGNGNPLAGLVLYLLGLLVFAVALPIVALVARRRRGTNRG